MARVTFVKKARKAIKSAGIKKGEPSMKKTVSTWREITGWPGYRVNVAGEVQSARTQGRAAGVGRVWKTLKRSVKDNGYPYVQLSINSRRQNRYVHDLVLRAFVGNPRPGQEACHNDGCRANCCLDNLRWGTNSENQADRVKHGTSNRGERHGNARLQKIKVEMIRFLVNDQKFPPKDVASLLTVSVQHVRAVAKGRRWRHI